MTELATALGELGVWVRLHYVYPYPHVDDVIPLMAEGKLLPYLDVPFQHASPRILKLMKRPANAENTLARIKAWRAICPDITIRSTFIAGFPGETEARVRASCWISSRKRNSIASAASRIRRSTAPSPTRCPIPCPQEVREERRARFMATQERSARRASRARSARRCACWWTRVDGDAAVARSAADAPEIDGVVRIEGARGLRVGEFATRDDHRRRRARPSRTALAVKPSATASDARTIHARSCLPCLSSIGASDAASSRLERGLRRVRLQRSSHGCGKEAPPPPRPAPEVTVITVEPKSIPYTPVFVAQTESSRQVNIVARVSGFLDSIAYQEGELVKQGQLLFKLDPKPFQAQLNAARGELESQQARYATADVTYGRVKPLADQDALPQTDLDRAKGELDAARAAVFSAQAKVDEAQLNLGYATITSPLTGVASRALQRQGAYVNSLAESANLTYVAALDPIWVNFSISQNQMARYKELERQGPGGAAQGRQLRRRARAARAARSIRSAARSALPIRRSARTPARSSCAR